MIHLVSDELGGTHNSLIPKKLRSKENDEIIKKVSKTNYSFSVIRLFIFSSFVQADDVDDIMNVVQSWAELENNLESQTKFIREDQVQITGSMRQSN